MGRIFNRRRASLSWKAILGSLAVMAIPATAQASEGHGPSPALWLTLAAFLLVAKLGAETALRLKQPPVLGELMAGILLGNLTLFGVDVFAHVPEDSIIEFLAEFGVVLLLFQVGLESTLTEMKKVAPQSGLVAIIGVVAPMGLGYGTSVVLIPDGSQSLHLFIGATLSATSVGITARVLKDLNAMNRVETRIILGAAVIDDVLGLIVLAIVSAIAASGTMPDAVGVAIIFGKSFGFLIGALILGAYVMPGFFRASSKLKTPGVLGAISIGLCLMLAGISAVAGLAAIVGAFAAGLILDEVHVQPFGKKSKHDLSEIVEPVVAVVAPIFFVRTGMMVQLAGTTMDALILAGALSVVAVIGKLVAGLGVRGSTADRLAVGIGMVPRGEVGLIFANV
ncbi:MAG: cation:proton antiporter, partial [Deltaproteobacteria bacterium]|nr:cation:proton antiporter [Deltaproteobacteria bacterium]